MTRLLGPTGALRPWLLVLASLALAAGACAGIVYWSWQGSLIGVALSALVPGTCALALLARSPGVHGPKNDGRLDPIEIKRNPRAWF